MKLHIVYSHSTTTQTTWGVATSEESLEKIKKQALDTMISDHNCFMGGEASESMVESWRKSIKVMDLNSDVFEEIDVNL